MALSMGQASGIEGRRAGSWSRPPNTGEAVLAIDGLHARYGRAEALRGVSFSVAHGQSLGILGKNGAGKTTLLRTIAGLHRQAQGSVRYRDSNLLGLGADEIARLGIFLVRDGGRVFENLSIADHLSLACRLASARNKRVANPSDLLRSLPILEERGGGTKAGLLSGGQRQVLCLAMAIASAADCLLLDEPSAGLAETTATEVFEVIRQLGGRGVTLIVAEQDPKWLAELVNRTVQLEPVS